MATYSAVTAGEKDADSPITVGLVDKLDQNPEAMFEGASGAPRLKRAAVEKGVGHRWFFDYGDETDGAITHSATASIAPGLYQCTTFQIDATYTVDLSAMGPLIICATTSITINGTLDVDGWGARGGRASSGTGTETPGQSGMFGGSGGGVSDGTDGGNTFLTAGGSGADGSAQSAKTKALLLSLMPVFNVGETALELPFNNDLASDCAVGGGGGGADDDAAANDGGEGGGLVVLCAPIITVGSAGVITADGTNGKGGASCGGGGGGAIILAYGDTLTEDVGSSVAASAGTGPGASGYDGGAGWVERIALT